MSPNVHKRGETMTELEIYKQQIFNFLKSMTIKSKFLADSINNNLLAAGISVDLSDPYTWKYYLNVSGEYHHTDTFMYIYSVDTQERIFFSKETLKDHPKTVAAYKAGSELYETLLLQYPTQVDLIKSIVYPCDVSAAIAASDLTVLSYGNTFLETDEQPFILSEIDKFLDFFALRWYAPWLWYEQYSFPAQWASLWQLLYLVIYTARVKAIKTSYVHSYHIWEYLTSNGLNDYRDILNRRQAMFLYRNLDYLYANQGKKSNLILLVNKLLKEIHVGMVGKVIYQKTDDNPELRWIPEIISEPIPTDFADILQATTTESVTDITYKLYKAGFEKDQSTLHIDTVEKEVGATPFNTLPTKILEIYPVIVDRKYADMLANFTMDLLVKLVNDNRYQVKSNFKDTISGLSIDLSPKEILALYYYCSFRERGDTPISPPTMYTPKGSYKFAPTPFPKVTQLYGKKYTTNAYIDVSLFNKSYYPPSVLVNTKEFDALLLDQFNSFVSQVNYSRAIHDHTTMQILHKNLPNVMDMTSYGLLLIPYANYDAWFETKGLNPLISKYNQIGANTNKAYGELADSLIELLVNPSSEVFLTYGNVVQTEEFYKKLKNLFIQLCSYDVLFLDTPRGEEHWVPFSKFTLDRQSEDLSHQVFIPTKLPYTTSAEGENFTVFDLAEVDMTTHNTLDVFEAWKIRRKHELSFRGSKDFTYSVSNGIEINNTSTESTISIPVGLTYSIM